MYFVTYTLFTFFCTVVVKKLVLQRSLLWENFQYYTAVMDRKKLYFFLNIYFNFSFQYDEEKEKELERSRKKKCLDDLEAQWLVSSISDSRPCW